MSKKQVYHPGKQVGLSQKKTEMVTTNGVTMNNGKPFKLMIGIPCTDMMHTDFVRCLMALKRPADSTVLFIKGTILPQSRDILASTTLSNGFTHLLFMDSDMNFPADALAKLAAHDADIVTGLAVSRREPHQPCIYSAINYTDADFAAGKPHIVTCDDWAEKGDYFEVAGCGMAFCLIKAEVLQKMKDTYGEFFKYIKTYGEDLSFCIRATSLGYKIMVDNSFVLGHIGQKTFTTKHIMKPEDVEE